MHPLRALVGLLALACLAALGGAAGAEDGDALNRVGFAVERTRRVENDQVTAVVSATHEDTDPARLADRINRDVGWALEQARAKPEIQAQTGGYRTHPVDDPKREPLRRWRGSQDLVLESGDAQAVSRLLGVLQERLQVQNLSFSVSRESRRQVEDELVDEALRAFRARAEQVRETLGARSWELVHVQVDTGGGPPQPLRRGGVMAMAEGVTPPALEAGTSEVTVRASGTVELRF